MSDLRLKLVLETIDKMTAPIKKMTSGFAQAMKKMREQMAKVNKMFSDMAKKIGDLGKKIRDFGQGYTTWITAPIIGAGAASVITAGKMEDLAGSLEAVAGGAEKAGEYMKALKAFSETSGKSIDEVTDSARILLAAGYTDGALVEQMRRIGEVSAGSKKPLVDLAATIAKIRLEGKMGKPEMESFLNSSIPIADELAKQLGKNRAQIINMAAEGKITARQVEKAMATMTAANGKYFNSMEKDAQRINGMWERFKASMTTVLSDIGFDIAKEFDIVGKMKAVTAAVKGLAEWFMKLSPGTKSFILWAGLIIALLGPLIMAVGLFTMGLASLTTVLGYLATTAIAVGGTLKLLSTILLTTPFGWFILGATAVAGAAFLIYKNWGKIKDFFSGIWTSVKQTFADGVAYVMDLLSPLLTRSASWLGKMNSIFSTSGLLPLLPSGIDTLDILSDGYASSAVSLYKTLRDLAAPKRTPVIGRAPVPVQVPSQTVAKALLKASDITVSDPITGSPSTAPVRLLNANAMDLYHRTMALSAAVGAVRHTSFESREEAISLRDGVTGRLEVLLDRLGEAEWDRSWSESRQMMAAIHRDIDDRIGRLPRTVQVRPAAVRSALALANRLYPDDTTQFLNKSADLVVRNRIRHPGFVPVQNLEVLVDAA